jgi:predicted CopG family antitoxin
MAVKTITIDLDAYEALARRKRPGQSFSDVIKAQFAAGGTGRELLEAVRHVGLEEETLNAIQTQVRARRRARARAPRLRSMWIPRFSSTSCVSRPGGNPVPPRSS